MGPPTIGHLRNSGADHGKGCSLGRETGWASQRHHRLPWCNVSVLALKEHLGSRGVQKVAECPQTVLCQGPQRQGVPGFSTLHA